MDLEQENNKQADFTRLLLKTPWEKSTQQIWAAFNDVVSGDVDVVNVLAEEFDKKRSEMKDATKLAQQLLAILNNEPVKAGKITVTDRQVLEAMKHALIEQYKANRLNQRHLTIEEAEADLKGWRNNKDAREWIWEQLRFLADECCPEEGVITDEDFDWFNTDPSNVEYYAESIIICEEVTPEQVLNKIKAMEKMAGGKVGRKVKNNKLHWLIVVFRRYCKRHRNEDYRLIFDCMDLFGLIDDVVMKAWNKKDEKELQTAKASYIKSIYKQAIRYESLGTQNIIVARN